MDTPLVPRLALGAIALLMAPVALQASLAPRAWFDDFPLGRGWIAAAGGSYDEHLVRDVGVLFLALVVVTAWSAWRAIAMGIVSLAWLVQGLLHVRYHVGHLDGLDGADRAGLVGSLVLVPVLAAIALVSVWRARETAAPSAGPDRPAPPTRSAVEADPS